MKYRRLRYLLGILAAITIIAVCPDVHKVHADDLSMPASGLDEIVFTYETSEESIEDIIAQNHGAYIVRDEDCAVVPDGLTLPLLNEAAAPDGSSRVYYNMLNENQKKIYDVYVEAVAQYINSAAFEGDLTQSSAQISGIVVSDKPMSLSDVPGAFEAFYWDNPQYYFLKGSCDYSSYSGGFRVATKVHENYYSISDRNEADAAIEEVTVAWLAELSTILNDSSKEADATKRQYLTALRLHDLIIDRINYAYDASGAPESKKFAHSIAGVCTEEGVVCEGYADMFSYMLNLLDIDNLFITGRGKTGNHAWNALGLDGEYYLCDVTWDDNNPVSKSDYRGDSYDYFCMPQNIFKKDHTPDSAWSYPSCSSKMDYAFVYYFCSYSAEPLTDEGAATLRDSALAHQYEYCDYIYFTVPQDSYSKVVRALTPPGMSLTSSQYGMVVKYLCPKITVPSLTANLYFEFKPEEEKVVATQAAIGKKDTIKFVIEIADGSDDRIDWSISDTKAARLITNGKTASVTGRRNSEVVLTAQTHAGKAVAECTIVFGTGASNADYYIWAGGSNDTKKVTITPTIAATDWTDARGKQKSGKLVWLTSDVDLEIKFDRTKHTITTKPTKKTRVSVTSRGVVTAKKPGTAFVYICDTGSCTYETYEIEVLAAPSKMYLSSKAESSAKTDLVTKVGMDVLSSDTVYIVPYLKDLDVDPDCTYSVALAKPEQAEYLSVSGVGSDEDGNALFTLTAKDYFHKDNKNKTVSVKVNVTNVQSNKKASMTIVIGNPVVSATATKAGSGTLAAKNDSLELNLSIVSKLGASYGTTDTYKLYVGKTYVRLSANGKKVETDKGATVKATLSKDKTKIVLKNSKDAGVPAVITLAVTDAITKQITLYPIATVDETGGVR